MPAPRSTPERITWAIEQLKPATGERILEIGCAGGHALTRIAAVAPRCGVVGIDRSPLQVRKARARLREAHAPESWRVEPLTIVGAARRWPVTFDKVLAINVNAFWVEPATSLPALAALLTKSGSAYIVYEPPSEARAAALAEQLPRSVEASGLRVRRKLEQRFERTLGVCFIIERSRASSTPRRPARAVQ